MIVSVVGWCIRAIASLRGIVDEGNALKRDVSAFDRNPASQTRATATASHFVRACSAALPLPLALTDGQVFELNCAAFDVKDRMTVVPTNRDIVRLPIHNEALAHNEGFGEDNGGVRNTRRKRDAIHVASPQALGIV